MKGLSEDPRKATDNDPKSAIPSQMLRVPIPEGSVLNVGEIRDGEVYKEFGISHMLYGMVSNTASESIEGTVLYFNDNKFRVDVGRRDLTAADINRIAKLSIDLDAIATIIASLPNQIKNAENLIKELRISENLFRDRLKKLNFDATQAISELGILLQKMKPSLDEQFKQWRETISELASLGVTQMHDQDGGILSGVPVREMAKNFAAESQKSGE